MVTLWYCLEVARKSPCAELCTRIHSVVTRSEQVSPNTVGFQWVYLASKNFYQCAFPVPLAAHQRSSARPPGIIYGQHHVVLLLSELSHLRAETRSSCHWHVPFLVTCSRVHLPQLSKLEISRSASFRFYFCEVYLAQTTAFLVLVAENCIKSRQLIAARRLINLVMEASKSSKQDHSALCSQTVQQTSLARTATLAPQSWTVSMLCNSREGSVSPSFYLLLCFLCYQKALDVDFILRVLDDVVLFLCSPHWSTTWPSTATSNLSHSGCSDLFVSTIVCH
jgi:hypothetical protein